MARQLLTAALLGLLPVLASSASQTPFGIPIPGNEGDTSGKYEFDYPIKKVAIVGAGIGGLITYRELHSSNYFSKVHIYERDDAPGGNWHYTDQVPIDAPIPNAPIVVGDYIPDLPEEELELPLSVEFSNELEDGKDGKENKTAEWRIREHRAPKPIWKTLSSNAPKHIQQIREIPYPPGTPWTLHNQRLQRYLRAFASYHGLNVNDGNPDISYNTRVELAERRFDSDGKKVGWTLTLRELKRENDKVTVRWWKEDYDAIVVATGRYNAPNIANIPGLEAWNRKFPGHHRSDVESEPNPIIHSRQYRIPEPYKDKTVLIIGVGVSGGEISRDIIGSARKVYQSVRYNNASSIENFHQLLLSRVPKNATIVPEIKEFLPPTGSNISEGKIELVNGTILTGIDNIIFATGFRYSYPFLPHLHNSTLGREDHADRHSVQPIVTDGTHLRSLYLDAFYIPDPTIVLINANWGMPQSFTHPEFLGLAIAKVWAGKADLPSESALWKWYQKEYEVRGGYKKGKFFQYMPASRTKEVLALYKGWLDASAVKYGGKQIDGLPDITEELELWARARFGTSDPFNQKKNETKSLWGIEGTFIEDMFEHADEKKERELGRWTDIYAGDW